MFFKITLLNFKQFTTIKTVHVMEKSVHAGCKKVFISFKEMFIAIKKVQLFKACQKYVCESL